MTENLNEQKKSFVACMSEMLLQKRRKTPNSWKSSRSKKGTKNNTVNSINIMENYVTWPSVKLRKTVEEIICRLINRNCPRSIKNIIDEVECEVDNSLPVVLEEQLDFCMMCPQVDHIKAVELQTELCREYDLVGKVLWECVPLGRDVFGIIEEMLNNSTKLLYYVTEKFDDADASAHIAKTLLIDQDNYGADRKVIPLVKHFDTPVPETFELVDKLYLSNKSQFQFRFPAIFTEEVRLKKVIRSEKMKRKLDDKRKLKVQNLVQSKLGGL